MSTPATTAETSSSTPKLESNVSPLDTGPSPTSGGVGGGGTHQRAGDPVDQAAKTASGGGDAPTRSSPDEAFLNLLANREKQSRAAGPVRSHGFVVVSPASSSLQPLQRLCFDKRQTFNTCLTARYRLGVGPVFGTLFSAFAEDLRALRKAREQPGVLGRLKGDLLPMGPDPLATDWGTLLQDADLEAATEELIGDDARANGIPLTSLERFFDLLRDQRLLPAGHRLVLFCELPAEQGHGSPPAGVVTGPDLASRLTVEWQAAKATILDRLPERVGLAFGTPDPITPTFLERDDVHQRLIAVDTQDLASGDVVQQFKPAALAGDRPAWRDLLGRAPFATAIARLILHPQTEPLTMGIEAPWGQGKSSFLNLISRALTLTACDHIDPALGEQLREADDQLDSVEREQLDLAAEGPAESTEDRQARETRARERETRAREVEDRRQRLLQQQDELWRRREHRARSDVVQVRFNAWRYQDATHIWAGLVSEVSKEVEASLPWHGRILAPLRYTLRQRTTELLVGVVLPTMLAVLVGVALYFLGYRVERADAANEVPSLLRFLVPGLGVLAVIVWRVYKVVQPVSVRMIDYVRLPDYRAQLGFQTQVLTDLAFLRGCLKRPRLRRIGGHIRRRHEDPKIVVFIDDLDRCSDATVMEVLQTINLILGESGLFVLLAVDTEKIHHAIANQYRNQGAGSADPSFAGSYMRKIVQLSFYLPRSDPQERLALVDQQFSPEARRRSGPSRERRPPSGTGGDQPGDTVFGVDLDAVSSPHVVTVSKVEDTPEELKTFRALKDFTSNNPRELKRVLNTHRFIKILLQRPETPPTEELQRKLVVWLIFCAEWPSLVNKVLDLAAESAKENPGQDCLDALVKKGDLGSAAAGLKAFQEAIKDAERALGSADHPAEIVLQFADLKPGSFLCRAAASSEMLRVDSSPAQSAELPPVTPSG
jgi:KAP family P-loop domain